MNEKAKKLAARIAWLKSQDPYRGDVLSSCECLLQDIGVWVKIGLLDTDLRFVPRG